MKAETIVQRSIAELDACKDHFLVVAVAVQVGDGVRLVHGHDSNRLEQLDELVRSGGRVFGIVGVEKDAKRAYCRALPGLTKKRDIPVLHFLSELQLARITGDFRMFPKSMFPDIIFCDPTGPGN